MVADTVHTPPCPSTRQAARRGPAPLDLLVAPGAPEHKTQKIEVAAALANINRGSRPPRTKLSGPSLPPRRDGRADDAQRPGHALRRRPETCPASTRDGSWCGRLRAGRVDQWLEFGTHELEVAVVAATRTRRIKTL